MTDQAKAIVDMMRAHQERVISAVGRGVHRRTLEVACKGTSDPLTGHWCQFRGSLKEHYRHQIERIEALLEKETADV